MAITQIKFINRYPVIRHDIKIGGQKAEWLFTTVDFKLGLGPCGKVVIDLDVRLEEGCLTIIQTHDDRTSKTFIYQLSDIAGRICVEEDNV